MDKKERKKVLPRNVARTDGAHPGGMTFWKGEIWAIREDDWYRPLPVID